MGLHYTITDGILCVNKPIGVTSAKCVSIIKRRLIHRTKVGHTGTLDPAATGMLAVCIGRACKYSSRILGSNKTYIAEMHMGITTNTGDSEGVVTSIRAVCTSINRQYIYTTLQSFKGISLQEAHAYSAVKINGRRSFDMARSNPTHRSYKIKPILIKAIDLIGFNDVRKTVLFRVECSSGVYIRSLVEDIGKSLVCGAVLTRLHRESIGNFDRMEELDHISPDITTSKCFYTLEYLNGINATSTILR